MRHVLARIRRSGGRYLRHPTLFIQYGKYLFNKVRERWPRWVFSLYVLEVPLENVHASTSIPTLCVNSIEPLLEFIQKREVEDPIWTGKYKREIEQRFSRGDLCFVVIEDGIVVCVLFATFKQNYVRDIDYLFVYGEKTFGIIDGYTLKTYRHRNYYRAVFSLCISHCKKLGYETIHACISPSNTISLRLHNSLGVNHIIGKISMYQRWGFRKHKIERLDIRIKEILNA